MARSFAKIHVGIWNDDDFLALDRDAMLTYQFILEQPKMRTCGVVDMQVRRWAPKLHMTTDELLDVLDVLTAAGFIAIDPDTEELAVRTFVKHDAGDTKNWKVWIGVWSSLGAVESTYLRSFVAFNMPDGAFEPKAKPTMTRPESIGDRSHSDSQSIEEKGDVIDSQSDSRSIPSGKSLATSVSVSATTTVADPPTHAPPDERPGGGDRIDTAAALIADHEILIDIGNGKTIANEGGYRRTITARIRTEQRLADLAARLPDATPEQLCERYIAPDPLASLDDLVVGLQGATP